MIYNSLDSKSKYPTGPIQVDEDLYLRIRIPSDSNIYNVCAVFREHGNWEKRLVYPMKINHIGYGYIDCELRLKFSHVNILWYYFTYEQNGGVQYIVREGDSFEGVIRNSLYGAKCWQLTVYAPMKINPEVYGRTMIQIFPDAYYNDGSVEFPKDRIKRRKGAQPSYTNDRIGKDFVGGTLNGIRKKLKYIRSFYFTMMYMNPIWEADTNHRYNAANLLKVDPVLGTNEDLKKLTRAMHATRMLFIIDAVFNHVGANSIYFDREGKYHSGGAYGNLESIYSDWFHFLDEAHTQYLSWWGDTSIPKLNYSSESLVEFIFGDEGVVRSWLEELEIDGFRLDVPDELENRILEMNADLMLEILKVLIIIGEVWEDASTKESYGHRMEYFLGKELTSVMNYPTKNAVLAYIRYGGSHWSQVLIQNLNEIFIENYPKEIRNGIMNFLSSHDTVRAITKLAGPEVNDNSRQWQSEHNRLTRDERKLGKKLLQIAYFLIYFLPGIPCVFYGDETGLEGYADPFCRAEYPWDRLDKKLLKFFRKLGKVRDSLRDFVADAEFKVIEITDSVCAYVRYKDDKELWVILNRTSERVDIKKYFEITTISDEFVTKTEIEEAEVLMKIGKSSQTSLDAYGAVLLMKERTM
jgi:glycosidase